MTVAAVDRRVHHPTLLVLEINVESYRRRAAHASAPAKARAT